MAGVMRPLERAFKSRAHRAAALLLGPGPGAPFPTRVDRILVTKQHNQMGDFILASPVIDSLSAAFPGAAVDYLASPVQAEAAGLSPTIRRVWLLDGKGISGRGPRLPGLVGALRRQRYDLALVLVTVSYSTTSALIGVLCGARYRVAGRIGTSPGGRSLFHREVAIPDEGHETDRALAHLRALGIEPSTRRPRLEIPREEVLLARKILGASGGARGDLWVGLHPGAGKLPNRWPAAAFGELGRRLLSREGIRLLLFAGPREEHLLSAMDLPSGPRVVRWAGVSLRAFAAAIKTLSLYVGNDTGALHLAAALGVPTLGLFGPTDPSVWAPVTPVGRVLRAPGCHLDRLPPETVESAIEKMLINTYSESR